MRYFYEKPYNYIKCYGSSQECSNPYYRSCTQFLSKGRGIAVVQRRFDPESKTWFYTDIDPWLCNDIYLSPRFKEYFDSHATTKEEGYFTIELRKLMWALRMKPIKREDWEDI